MIDGAADKCLGVVRHVWIFAKEVFQGVLVFLDPKLVYQLHVVSERVRIRLAGVVDHVLVAWLLDGSNARVKLSHEELVPALKAQMLTGAWVGVFALVQPLELV